MTFRLPTNAPRRRRRATPRVRDDFDQIEELAEERLRRLDPMSAGDLRNDISSARYRMLTLLHHQGPMSIGSVARLLKASHSKMSEKVSRLAQLGLVSRTRSVGDERVVVIDLTDKGRQTILRGRERLHESYAALCDRLSAAERDALLRALQELNALLRRGARYDTVRSARSVRRSPRDGDLGEAKIGPPR
jgi:DNA-binding MarR family transcriptional regulator